MKVAARLKHTVIGPNWENVMSDNPQQSVADSLEVDKKLLPYMPYLLQDLWALGSAVDEILDLFSTLPLSPGAAKVLDLGCGKGAVSIQIASKFGFDVVGVDAMPEFLKDAHRKSSEYTIPKHEEGILSGIVILFRTVPERELIS